jgi:alkylation response protein AidB-like acyl-CoA dehydrogenase
MKSRTVAVAFRKKPSRARFSVRLPAPGWRRIARRDARAVRDESDACWGGRNPTFKNEAQKRWLEVMAERGWTVPDWPKEYGGGGLRRPRPRS